MALRKVELLLNRTIESLGIVGDVVKVKPGYARNYLLPHLYAEAPTPEKIEALKGARAAAQAELSKLRSERELLMSRMEGLSIKLIRSVNDSGVLYGAVTQRDISDQLTADGFGVDMRAVRLQNPIRRIGHYTCAIQLDRDLRTEVAIEVLPDRTLEMYTAPETPDTDDEAPAPEPEVSAVDAPEDEAPAKGAKGKKKKKD
ncbi:MAG: 50S ribosomal protein L9 [Phycisphaerae bacterium]|nr:50S ribosomal protein L9 [Phycisphaerae bacterium]